MNPPITVNLDSVQRVSSNQATQKPSIDAEITAGLQAVLRDTYALAAKTHAAHWNVTGLQFFSLHEAFGQQYEALYEAADELAERIRALGEMAPVGVKTLSESHIKDLQASSAIDICVELATNHQQISARLAELAQLASDHGDEGSADLSIARMQDHDKTAWMLGATAA